MSCETYMNKKNKQSKLQKWHWKIRLLKNRYSGNNTYYNVPVIKRYVMYLTLLPGNNNNTLILLSILPWSLSHFVIMKFLGCEINTLNKLRLILSILTLLTLAVIIYNVERIANKLSLPDDVLPSEIAIHVIMFMVTCLTIVVNLLLYQGALDLASIDLYFWPDPKYCKIWWLVVYIPIALVYLYGAVTCLYWSTKDEKSENIFIKRKDNFVAWGFLYLIADCIVIASIYFVNTLYSKF